MRSNLVFLEFLLADLLDLLDFLNDQITLLLYLLDLLVFQARTLGIEINLFLRDQRLVLRCIFFLVATHSPALRGVVGMLGQYSGLRLLFICPKISSQGRVYLII